MKVFSRTEVATLLFMLSIALDPPQLLWVGEVDGAVVLHVRADRLEVEQLAGLPVQRQQVRFYEPLPEDRVTVRLDVIEGRGRVRILEQPRRENDYTLKIGIEDPPRGAGWYVLAIHWNGGRWPAGRGGGVGLPQASRSWLRWEGQVDGEVLIHCAANQCVSEVRSGRPVIGDRHWSSAPMPRAHVPVSLEVVRGRGEVRLVQQPDRTNAYRATVWIRDPQPGASEYAFVLSWPEEQPAPPLVTHPGGRWEGRVDGRVRVRVEGDRAEVEVVSGAPVEGARYTAFRPLPAEDLPQLRVRRLRGRGRVQVIEYPSARNGYQLVFEIDDPQGGAADYQVEVGW